MAVDAAVVEAAGAADGRYPLGPLTVEVTDGAVRVAGTDTLAGSTLTMDGQRVEPYGPGIPFGWPV